MKVLVVGFYDRDNAGDDLYKIVIPRIFADTKTKFIFITMDDLKQIPADISFIICGGGDIINSYFMEKAMTVFANYTGKIYAFSVGIPYSSESRYLHIFDHVFVRSTNDYKLACAEVGSKNVTYLPDAAFCLIEQPSPKRFFFTGNKTNTNLLSVVPQNKKIGVCLAQPCFNDNSFKDELLNQIRNAFSGLSSALPNIEIHLISFNYSINPHESDFIVHHELYEKLSALKPYIKVVFPEDTKDPIDIFDYLKNMDVIIGMRYHSIVFSLILQKPFIALVCSQKLKNLLNDFPFASSIHNLPLDNNNLPINIDSAKLTEDLVHLCTKPQALINISKPDYSVARELMFIQEKSVAILVKNNYESFDHVLFNCKKVMIKYLKLTELELIELLYQQKSLNSCNVDITNLARLLCYCITKSMQSPYIWGLAENMTKDDFCLLEAIKYIWNDYYNILSSRSSQEVYYPELDIQRKVFVNMDFVFQNDFKEYHRSGWSYVVGGMMNIDSHQLLRKSKNNIMFDTYVDRSFHWGHDTLETIGLIPYSYPWIGIIHHTFDTTHSEYNCVDLFKNENFIKSLETCKSLITLTKYLAVQVRQALDLLGFQNIPINVVYHPMETVPTMFTFDKFMKNPDKKIVQIGAWLRNPYAIYELNMWKNTLNIRKCALRGKDMDQYFKPNGLLEKVRLFLYDEVHDLEDLYKLQRPVGISEQVVNVCGHILLKKNQRNKYCTGLYDFIQENDRSVSILNRMNNDEYDKLLSENIVFLNLVDCSAVNTVLECIVRNTVIIVNRHPAVEEVLGKNYPCFYENLTDASVLVNDKSSLKAAYNYLRKLDKTRFELNYFIDELQEIILSCN